ncbi:hypothetical protein HPB51_010835 [Rhipicephalus microplus]|uniref:UBX domain-containing protein 4 n=1 Tax=Rhipicephalus microplus TaxID=6941 RepID=A0A9J6DM52_RHIMP|nr:hypothetical protein HPB51_010835 [Rhipicephalus microplus]
MKWFEGSIPEAIALAKSKQQLFLVFIEDPVVVVPSSFFIGCNGIPLEVIAGSVEPPELLNRIDKLFQKRGKQAEEEKSSDGGAMVNGVRLIDDYCAVHRMLAEMETDAAVTNNDGPSTKLLRYSLFREPTSVGDNGSVPTEAALEPAPSASQAEVVPSTEAPPSDTATLEERVERAKRLVEERRLQKIKEEEEAVRQSEIKRRRVARELQMAQESREDQQRRELARQRAQDKEEERKHRERIQAQIAQDRADRAEKYHKEKAEEEQLKRQRETQRLLEQQQKAVQEAAARSQVARIQFRLPDGSSAAHTFDAAATLQDLHDYVVETVQPSFSNFTLSTTFPRREFTQEQYQSSLRELELAPSAVILVVPVSTPSVVVPAAVSKSGASLMNLLWSLLTPFGVIWSLFVGLILGHLTLQCQLPTAAPQLSAVTSLLLGLKSSSKHRGAHADGAQHRSRRVKVCTNVKGTYTASLTNASVMKTMTPTPGMGTPLSRCSLAFK